MPTRCREGETPEQARKRQALYAKEWRKRNYRRYIRKRRAWSERNRDHLNRYERQRFARRWNESDDYRRDCLARLKRWRESVGKEYLNKQARARTLLLKLEVVAAYGGRCSCCGVRHFHFLTVEHKDGKGADHRKKLFGNAGAAGHRFYLWLKSKGFPKKNLELLCWNCNLAKAIYGKCPHKKRS